MSARLQMAGSEPVVKRLSLSQAAPRSDPDAGGSHKVHAALSMSRVGRAVSGGSGGDHAGQQPERNASQQNPARSQPGRSNPASCRGPGQRYQPARATFRAA